MAAPSFPTFTLSSHHSPFPKPRFIHHSSALYLFKFPILNSPSPVCHHPTLRQPVDQCSFSSKTLTNYSVFSASPAPPRKEIRKFFVERVSAVLLGSLIFMGCLKSRPALAQPVQESEKLAEKRDSQFGSEEEVMCEKLLEEDSRNVEALKMVVNLKIKKGKTKEAVGYVERLIELQPNEMEWRLLQALCYEMMGHLSKAKSLFKDILKQKPLLLRALHGMAMVMHKNHEDPAVFEMLERSLDLARQQQRVNEERNIRILIAQMHLIKGDLELALEKFQALIDENPRDFRPYLCQGIVYSLLDKKKEANESFEVYHSLVPEEFPQRVFLDDVVLAAKTGSRQQLQKEL